MMKDRLQLLFIVFFFGAWGFWWGSSGASIKDTLAFGLGSALAVWLLLLLTYVKIRTWDD